MVERDRVEQPAVAEHAEERQEGERDEPVRLLARHALDELEHLRRRDAVELGAELERRERVEERALRDLAHRGRQVRVEEPVRQPREAEQAAATSMRFVKPWRSTKRLPSGVSCAIAA